MSDTPRLCYVRRPWAFFTTQPVEDQWGDDWNDAPYEHNAGDPYTYLPNHDDGEPWDIIKVAFTGNFEVPGEWSRNSRYSVEDINEGQVAWLTPPRHGNPHRVHIHAGETLDEFVKKVQRTGGDVYFKTEIRLPTEETPDAVG